MPNIGVLHPQIVHFVIALLVIGVIARLLSLVMRRWTWLSPMATTLIVLGTLAAVLGVKSGDDAHGPAERIPGARDVVVEHEEWGERARNLFLIVAALELGAFALRGQRERFRQWVRVVSAAGGVIGLWVLYETAEHGGEVVYSYAGGVGTRSGDTADVHRLLVAGLYQQAMVDRRAGRSEEAAVLIEQLGRRRPDDITVKFLAAESQLLDRKDPRAALRALATIPVAEGDTRSRIRRAFLTADAYVAAGRADSARVVLEALARDFPDDQRIRQRLSRL